MIEDARSHQVAGGDAIGILDPEKILTAPNCR